MNHHAAAGANPFMGPSPKTPDKRLADEEIILRYFSFQLQGVEEYRTPLKNWLNDTARMGRRFSDTEISDLREKWENALKISLVWFDHKECFRRPGGRAINRALFDLIMHTATKTDIHTASEIRDDFIDSFNKMLSNEEFLDLISRSVDHKKRTERRFEIWNGAMQEIGL